MRAGAKSCARTPLLGDAFLISAMIAGGPAVRAARKSRREARRRSAARSQACSGWTWRARSARFLATIRARMSGTVSIKGVDPMVSETLGGNGEVGSFRALNRFGGTTTGQAVRRGKPWDRQPVSGKLRRKLVSVPGLRRPRGQLAPKRLSTRSFSEPRKAAGAGGVVTQNPRVECISCGWVSPFSAWGCGVGGRFCDANGSILRTPPVVWQPRVWDGYEGLEGCMHIADSRLALGREGFRFPGLGTIENEGEKKSQSW